MASSFSATQSVVATYPQNPNGSLMKLGSGRNTNDQLKQPLLASEFDSSLPSDATFESSRVERMGSMWTADPLTRFREENSRTRVGILASNMAYGSAIALFILGLSSIVWGSYEGDKSVTDQLTGSYSLALSIAIVIFEWNYGSYRNPSRFPYRALGYLLLSGVTFAATPTTIAGTCLVCTAVANLVSALMGETYTPNAVRKAAKRKRRHKLKHSGEHPPSFIKKKKSIWRKWSRYFTSLRCPSIFRKHEFMRKRIGRLLFILSCLAVNGVVFAYALMASLDRRNTIDETKKQR